MELKEFVEETGATPRQLRHWIRNGMAILAEPLEPGSGHRWNYNEEMIPRVRLVTHLSNLMKFSMKVDVLVAVFNNYELGWVDIGPIRMSWDPRNR